MKRENSFQANLIKELKEVWCPGCMVLKNDANYIQGVPDLLILYGDRWAALEVKRSSHEAFRPNQAYYVNLMNDMSFAAVIFPENKEEVLYELQIAFGIT